MLPSGMVPGQHMGMAVAPHPTLVSANTNAGMGQMTQMNIPQSSVSPVVTSQQQQQQLQQQQHQFQTLSHQQNKPSQPGQMMQQMPVCSQVQTSVATSMVGSVTPTMPIQPKGAVPVRPGVMTSMASQQQQMQQAAQQQQQHQVQSYPPQIRAMASITPSVGSHASFVPVSQHQLMSQQSQVRLLLFVPFLDHHLDANIDYRWADWRFLLSVRGVAILNTAVLFPKVKQRLETGQTAKKHTYFLQLNARKLSVVFTSAISEGL
jgi:hypothetical protein